jgi:alkanesulfonate monooxygenase SsuD/methylene tetrahydromethanopterin reductase-like flavin-dependent oxidoreductase (luciferase family)
MTSPATGKRQVHLGAHFPGVNHTTVWSDPESGSHIDFSSFEALARTAERGLFDFFFLAEGLRLREHRGRIHDLDVVGRPDTFPVLAALAAVTERLGLIGTINATFNEPYEVARQFATLDHLSGGRAGWNVVTSPDAFTGENFRRGGYLPREQRYEHAAELVDVARLLWGSWPEPVDVEGRHHRVSGRFDLPPGPQGEPVLLQAGDSEDGRDFGASRADAIFTPGRPVAKAREFTQAMKDRLPALGRQPDDLLVLPGVTFVLGDTDADAEERAAEVRRQQVSGPTAVRLLELLWNRDLSSYDPDGPLPEDDPFLGESDVVQGQVQHHRDRLATAAEWPEQAESQHLSIRELMIEKASRQTFVGSPRTVAAQLDDWVQTGAADGFILVPHLTPGGLDAFVDQVVPELQDRGVHRTEYTGTTLRDHLGLPAAGTRRPRLETS